MKEKLNTEVYQSAACLKKRRGAPNGGSDDYDNDKGGS